MLALDIGTSSVRAILFDSLGVALPGLRHQEPCEPDSAEPGQATFDPDDLVQRIATCIDAVLSGAGNRGRSIRAVGVTTFWHSMVGVDGDGRAATPLYNWADTRSAPDAEALKLRLDASATHARTGCAIHPSYFPARLAWLQRTAPEMVSQVDRWLSPGEYLFLRLFGRAECSISMASATGLFDQNGRAWDAGVLGALQVSASRFASLTDVDRPASGLLPEFSRRWPFLASVPWIPAIGDGAASNVGSGCVTADRIAINLGTSGAIRVCFEAEQVEIPDDLWCYRLDGRRFVMGGAFSDGGEVAVWMRDTLNLGDWKKALEEVQGMEPDSHGLTFLPFLAGERSTGWRPHARATLHGLSSSTTPTQIIRAGMEAVALRFSLVYRSLRRRFPDASQIIAAGGAFEHAPFWAQILSDALGVPLLLSEETEATSRGAALVALRVAGLIQTEGDVPDPPMRIIEPDLRRHAVYQHALARQQDLYAAMASK